MVNPSARQVERAGSPLEAFGATSGLSASARARSECMIQFDKVTKLFRVNGEKNVAVQEITALHDVSASVSRRELVALLGPSGCGKTTLLRIAAGLIPLNSGSVFIEGSPVTQPRKDACTVFQGFGLLPWRTVISNTEFPLELDGVASNERSERARKFLALVGMTGFESYLPPSDIGRNATASWNCSGIDPATIYSLYGRTFRCAGRTHPGTPSGGLLKIWGATESTVLFVTHSIDEALTLADRIFDVYLQTGSAHRNY